MDIDADLHYPAGPDRVMKVISDPAFQDEKCRQTGALTHTASVTTPGDRVVIHTVRNMPTDSLPDFAKTFLGGKLEVREVQEWGPAGADGARDGTLRVEIANTPMKLDGTMAMRPAGADATDVTIRSALKANIPFIGGKAEQAAAGPIRAAITKEEELGTTWLTR
ncbi:MAG: DUF2505 domain-containing protein [Actinomycetales bacterium]